jgi:hypothetical protein
MSARRAALAVALGALLAAAAPASAQAEIWLFTDGLLCDDPKDVAEVVDAPVVRLRIVQKVLSGECLSNSTLPPRRISPPETRISPGGKRFVCFREARADAGDFEPGLYCALPSSVATLAAKLARRKGEYEVVSRVANAARGTEVVKVNCTEGGQLTFMREREQFIRVSFLIFNVASKPAYVAALDLDTAMREGCKGADYRR